MIKKCVLFIVSLLFITSTLFAAKVKNRLNQPLVITLSSGKTIRIHPRRTARISERDMQSPEIKRLISNGKLIVVPGKKAKKKKKGDRRTDKKR
ncbi:MAG: hypothetical protein GY754_00495 [bacterium]|nr:hypothetical protein [bacterium]